MKNLHLNTGVKIFSFLFLSSVCFGQNFKKISQKQVEKNNLVKAFSYVFEDTYSRSILFDNDTIYSGNADGSLVTYSLPLSKSVNLTRKFDLTELRDVERCGNYLYGMQSGKTGKIIQFDQEFKAKIIEYPNWKHVFLNGMDFYHEVGFMMGDPVDTNFSLFYSMDCGNHWEKCKGNISPITDEIGYAASGTNVQVLNDSTFVFVTGGWKSRFFKSTNLGQNWTSLSLPFFAGNGNGAASICFKNELEGIVVGGDYKNPGLNLNCVFYTQDGGESWYRPVGKRLPRGYQSCVTYSQGIFYACGPNGIDFSPDGGESWYPFANGYFFSLTTSADHLFATMKNGKIKKMELIKGEEDE